MRQVGFINIIFIITLLFVIIALGLLFNNNIPPTPLNIAIIIATAFGIFVLLKLVLVAKYNVSRLILAFVNFIGFMIVLIGTAVPFIFGFATINILIAIGIAVSGFFLIMSAQITRAVINTADYAREILIKLSQK